MIKQVPQVLDSYFLNTKSIEPLQSADNHVFKIYTTDDLRFILRIHHGFGFTEEVKANVVTEFEWLEYINSKTDLVVPRPVRMPNGEALCVIDIEGHPHICVLFDWIEGESAESFLDSQMLNRTGSTIAKLHKSSIEFSPTIEKCQVYWDQSHFFGPDSWIERGQLKTI